MFYSLCSALLENASWSYHLDNLAFHQSLYQDFGKDSMWFLEMYLDIITGKTDAENCYDDCRSMQPENETLSLVSSLLTVLNVDRQWPWIPRPLESYVHCGVPLSLPEVFGTPEPLMQNTDSSFVVSCLFMWVRKGMGSGLFQTKHLVVAGWVWMQITEFQLTYHQMKSLIWISPLPACSYEISSSVGLTYSLFNYLS